jgi:two-component system, sensor histidine kinase
MSLPDNFVERFTDELRQQMEGVQAFAERLARQPLDPEGQFCVAGIVETAASVRQIIADAADLQASTNGELELSARPARLQEVMDQIQAHWGQRAGGRAATLLVSYDGDPDASAMVDAERLRQVFDGFIGQALASGRRNAVEASLRAVHHEEGMRLEGRVRGGGDPVSISPKIDVADLEEKFGLEVALGVALGSRLVTELGGSLRSEPNPGAGQTIVFEFATEAVPDENAAPAQAADATRSAHVLVVDDNATNRMVAETLCEMFDCTAESAVDGVEAVEAAATGRFDLILMDIKMPRMDGVAATRAIRSLDGPPGRVPIIALTANADPDDAAAYLAAGMNGVVEKPMKPENLLHALQEALAGTDAAVAA